MDGEAPEASLGTADVHALVAESEGRFRTMADHAPVLLWMSGTDGLCTFFNQTWLAFTGRSLEMEVGTGWAEGVHAEDFQRCMTVYLEAFVKRQPFRMEYRLRRQDGQYRWILDTGTPRFGPDRQFQGYIGSCIDVTELRDARENLERTNEDLERRVEERTVQLSRSNSDLAQFAAVASHDLQEPLRKISTYLRLLERRSGRNLDVQSAEWLGAALVSAQRMQDLICGLLTYSKFSNAPREPAALSCDAALTAALDNLSQLVEESGAKVRRSPLPTLKVDRTQMVILFQNLVHNAIRYRRQCPPEVSVTAQAQRLNWLFRVEDNGIGLDVRRSGEIFELFGRLGHRDQPSGAGIGLAVCKRVVEGHGGRIWVESTPGTGSTFFFTLPA
jgi:PAS domain S-box-containing protein